jgi:NAD(P)-dependent dehydrogenase (short-subunit alcohol dehydrogenase family)
VRALVVGASGGLGLAVAEVLRERGAEVAAAVRDPARLRLRGRGLGFARVVRMDLADPGSIEAAAAELRGDALPDIIVNATGVDARKSLAEHTLEEIDRVLDVDLRGPILLTKAFLPAFLARGSGTIMHFGGFADGRLAFPFYSADVAARAGLRSFVESMNRELAGTGVSLCFFSPAVADTEAERPFMPLWKGLGIRPVAPEAVGRAAAAALAEGERVHIMGGFSTRLFAAINAVWPGLADRLLLDGYGKALRSFLAIAGTGAGH